MVAELPREAMARSKTDTSKHLEAIITKKNRTATVQVVFIDIEAYSRRRSQVQQSLIDKFTGLLHDALKDTGRAYADYERANKLSVMNDVLLLPTGDGAGVVFAFDGLNDIHLYFARTLLRLIHEMNTRDSCETFAQDGWCNCHTSFAVRIGISEGKAVFYKDVNGRLNIAGRTVNLAARVMGLADGNQIVVTEAGFQQIADLVDDPHLTENFRLYRGVHLKDGEKIDVYQYVGIDEDYVSSRTASRMTLKGQFDAAARRLAGSGVKIPQDIPDAGRTFLVDMIHGLAGAFAAEPDESKSPYLEAPATTKKPD
jgi:class 3 adenylate cyclase